jgi:hypothetical protein
MTQAPADSPAPPGPVTFIASRDSLTGQEVMASLIRLTWASRLVPSACIKSELPASLRATDSLGS